MRDKTESDERMKKSFKKWNQSIKEHWKNVPQLIKYLVLVAAVLGVLLIIPLGIKGEEGNLLGIQSITSSESVRTSYSAEPLNGEKRRTRDNEVAQPTVSEVDPSAVSPTANGLSKPSNDELESVYEEQRKEINVANYSSQRSAQSSSQSLNESSDFISSNNANTPSEGNEGAPGTYTIQAGDNLYRIAANNGMTLEELMALNGMSEPYIAPGMTIRIQ